MLSLGHLGLNVLLVTLNSVGLLLAVDRSMASGFVDRLIRGSVIFAAQIVLAGYVLGYGGALNAVNLTVFHGFTLLLFCFWPRVRANFLPFLTQILEHFQRLSAGKPRLMREEYLLLAILLITCCAAGFFSLAAPPIDFDSAGYRLSRIGLWLQEGSLLQTATSDPRMNYTAICGDLLQLWVTAPFSSGYPGVGLVQFTAGVLVLLTTIKLGLALGFGTVNALMAGVLLIGMPVFISQMTTEQVDLLTAFFSLAGIYLLYTAFQEGSSTWLGWVSVALAIGTKGTLLYLGPGLLLLAALWIWQFRLSLRRLAFQIPPFLITLTVFAAPRYVETYVTYGNPFGDAESVTRLRGLDERNAPIEKAITNLPSYGLQVFSPDSNRPIPRDLLVSLFGPYISTLPRELDPHSLSIERGPFFAGLFLGQTREIPSLMGSSGFLAPVLSIAGIVLLILPHGLCHSLRRWRLAAFLPVILLHTFFISAFFQWSPYTFRFFLLVLPFVALIACVPFAAIGNTRVAGAFRVAIASLAFLSGMITLFQSDGVGWRAWHNPEQTLTGATLSAQQLALDEYLSPGAEVAVGLAYYAPLKSFFRHPKGFHVDLFERDTLSRFPTPQAFLNATGYEALFVAPNTFPSPESASPILRWEPPSKSQSFHAFECYVSP